MKNKKKIIIIFLILGIIAFIAIVSMIILNLIKGNGSFIFVEKRIEMYKEFQVECFAPMPALDEIGTYEAVEAKRVYKTDIIFSTDSYILKAKYNDEEYISQKEILNQKYSYAKNNIEQDTMFHVQPFPVSFSYNDIDFRVLNLYDFPKYIMLIGTNDKTHEITYVYSVDTDLDFVESPEDLMVDCIGFDTK